MCLATVYKKQEEPDSILLQYVSKILVDGKHITLIDVMGEERQLDGTIQYGGSGKQQSDHRLRGIIKLSVRMKETGGMN